MLAATPDLAAATGSACHAGTTDGSPVLLAMGLSRTRARAALRLSLGRGTSAADVHRAADMIVQSAGALAPVT
jgi:cysteine desulfurase